MSEHNDENDDETETTEAEFDAMWDEGEAVELAKAPALGGSVSSVTFSDNRRVIEPTVDASLVTIT